MIQKVKFVGSAFISISYLGRKDDLTIDKIYDVIQYTSSTTPFNDHIRILDDNGLERAVFLRSSEDIYFVDATSEFRNEVIKSILK